MTRNRSLLSFFLLFVNCLLPLRNQNDVRKLVMPRGFVFINDFYKRIYSRK